MMLWAEQMIDPQVAQPASYIAAMVVGGICAKLIDLFNKRDERRHDARLITLNGKVETLETKVAECEKHRDECTELKAEHAKLKKTVERIRRRADKHHPEDSDEAKPADDSEEHAAHGGT